MNTQTINYTQHIWHLWEVYLLNQSKKKTFKDLFRIQVQDLKITYGMAWINHTFMKIKISQTYLDGKVHTGASTEHLDGQ